MEPQAFVFFGLTGSGKGTQTKLIIEKLKKSGDREVITMETGQALRDFTSEKMFTAKLTKDVLDNGGLMPDFMPIWLWSKFFIYNFSGEEHVVLDGVSRRLPECAVLEGTFRFYGIKKPNIVYIEISKEEVLDRLKKRARYDDNEENIKKKLDWFYDTVSPSIDYFRNNDYFNFISINGEQSVEDVHKEILKKANLE